MLGEPLGKGFEGFVYKVRNINDGNIYSAKMRFNPATDREC